MTDVKIEMCPYCKPGTCQPHIDKVSVYFQMVSPCGALGPLYDTESATIAAHNTLSRSVNKAARSHANQALCIEWRGIENPCKKCGGSGYRSYPSTATWHGGIGGQAITRGICNRCWGSGDEVTKWVDLRKVKNDSKKLTETQRNFATAVKLLKEQGKQGVWSLFFTLIGYYSSGRVVFEGEPLNIPSIEKWTEKVNECYEARRTFLALPAIVEILEEQKEARG